MALWGFGGDVSSITRCSKNCLFMQVLCVCVHDHWIYTSVWVMRHYLWDACKLVRCSSVFPVISHQNLFISTSDQTLISTFSDTISTTTTICIYIFLIFCMTMIITFGSSHLLRLLPITSLCIQGRTRIKTSLNKKRNITCACCYHQNWLLSYQSVCSTTASCQRVLIRFNKEWHCTF